MKKKLILLNTVLFFLISVSYSQDDLINKIKNNASDNAKFQFTIIKDLAHTSVKNQASSGTCWSYSTNSFLESEAIRLGKNPINLAEIYSARNCYVEKAKQYLLWDGAINWGDGGEPHDVINMYRKYGAMPQELYTGLHYGTTTNKFAELQTVLKDMLDDFKKKLNGGKLSPVWEKAFTAVLDTYLGEVPHQFIYEGKSYTPQSFAKEYVGINPDDYVEISSYKDYPYYKKFVIPIPDNWSHDAVYNVHMTELTDIVDNAINKGYTVEWATDVSEPYFSWKNGVAYVPDVDLDNITPDIKAHLFDEPKTDKAITEDMRQTALNDMMTTDDHGMQIVGSAKDQNGKEYYIVKNSWGESNDYKGFIYVTKAYVQFKTTAILLHKDALPSTVKKELNIN